MYGVSTQTSGFQLAFVQRNGIPFPLLSDVGLELVRTMRLPTFEYAVESGGPNTLIRRMAWHVQDGVIRRVWYPVFPPDRCAEAVLAGLGSPRSAHPPLP